MTLYRTSKLRALFLFMAFAGGFYGYNFIIIGIHAAGLGHDSRIFSMPYRAFFLAFSLIMIFYGIMTRSFSRIGFLWFPLLIFWFLYFFRIAMDGYIFPISLNMQPIEYIQRAVGMTFIPMFIFLMLRSPKENDLAFKAFWMFNIGCIFFALLLYRDVLGNSYRSVLIFGTDDGTMIAPIALSYFGVVGALISFQLILFNYSHKKLRSLLLYVVLIASMIIVFMGGSRSAQICVILVSIVMILAGRRKLFKSSKSLLYFLLVFTAIGVSIYMVSQWVSLDTTSRYEGLLQQLADRDEHAGTDRLGIYLDTLDQIMEDPVFGSSLIINARGTYPHNHILEVFMATGIIGGLCFILLCWVTLKRCYLILQKNISYGWIAIAFMVFFILGLFSGSIISSNLWYTMLAVYAVPIDEAAA